MTPEPLPVKPARCVDRARDNNATRKMSGSRVTFAMIVYDSLRAGTPCAEQKCEVTPVDGLIVV